MTENTEQAVSGRGITRQSKTCRNYKGNGYQPIADAAGRGEFDVGPAWPKEGSS